MVLALGRVAPQGAADQCVDAVGTHDDVGLLDAAIGQVQPDRAVVVRDAIVKPPP